MVADRPRHRQTLSNVSWLMIDFCLVGLMLFFVPPVQSLGSH